MLSCRGEEEVRIDAHNELSRVIGMLVWVDAVRRDPKQPTLVYKLCDELATLLRLRVLVLTGGDRSHAT